MKRLRDNQNIRDQEENDEDPEELMASVQATSSYAVESVLAPVEKIESEFSEMNLGVSKLANSTIINNPSSEIRGSSQDLLDMDDNVGGNQPQNLNNTPNLAANINNNVAGYAGNRGEIRAKNVVIPYSVVFNESQPTAEKQLQGIQVQGAFQREGEEMFLYLKVGNKTNTILSVENSFKG